MSTAHRLSPISQEDYLAGEEIAARRHEYVNGAIYAQAGGSNAHNLIASNTQGLLFTQLRGKPCRAFNSDTKIRIRSADDVRFYYPDAVVICEPNPPSDTFQDAPKAIFEVTSPSTRRVDQGEKRDAYLKIESLEYYVILDQDSPSAVVYQQNEAGFTPTVLDGLDQSLKLEALDCSLRLADIYDGVVFTAADSEEVDG
ncbi:MAG: Uma2 family endonuclease [Aureliella sp.]